MHPCYLKAMLKQIILSSVYTFKSTVFLCYKNRPKILMTHQNLVAV